MQKKIINDPLNAAVETMEGFEAAYLGDVKKLPDHNALVRSDLSDRNTTLLIGGGSGHEPLWGGFIGPGLADAVVCGDVFAAPGPDAIFDTIKAVDQGAGVVMVHCNYAGDNMNFQIASELAADAGIETKIIRVWDDIATGTPDQPADRRGLAGCIYVLKVAAAAITNGAGMDEVHRLASLTRDRVRTLGVAVKPGSIPATGKPTFEIGDDEIEIGMGSHGEPGVRRQKLTSADTLVESMMELLLNDHDLAQGDRIALMINNLGSTTFMELCIINRHISAILNDARIEVHRTDIGSFLTTQEMAGFSISVLKLDNDISALLDQRGSGLVMNFGGAS
tara:strand:+ start:1370 stop:2377 length:1008 start_codon:yes stop_codon:yes gene_type:complete